MLLKKNKSSSDISSKIKFNKKKSLTQICQEWYQNKLNNPLNPINPQTEYTVKQNGPKYRELEKLCKTVKIIINDKTKKQVTKLEGKIELNDV